MSHILLSDEIKNKAKFLTIPRNKILNLHNRSGKRFRDFLNFFVIQCTWSFPMTYLINSKQQTLNRIKNTHSIQSPEEEITLTTANSPVTNAVHASQLVASQENPQTYESLQAYYVYQDIIKNRWKLDKTFNIRCPPPQRC